jgi:hypothetical protein
MFHLLKPNIIWYRSVVGAKQNYKKKIRILPNSIDCALQNVTITHHHPQWGLLIHFVEGEHFPMFLSKNYSW